MNNNPMTDPSASKIRKPKIETNTDTLPSAVTFFMNREQRRTLLQRLKEIHADRTRAIFITLDIEQQSTSIKS